MSAADQQIPDDARVVLEELITGLRRRLANSGMDNGTTQLSAPAMCGRGRISLTRPRSSNAACLAERLLRVLGRRLQSLTRPVS
jgi:hypothetical protein